jgi:1-phosphofructokinase family hexose kinase
MFLCVSANPAIDKRLRLQSLLQGRVNRARSVESFAGGKAAHVAMVLRTLGEKPMWLGPYGGANGKELLAGLSQLGIEATGIPTKQVTRMNLEILESDGTVTEILEPGTTPSKEEWAAFEAQYRDLLAKDTKKLSVVLSGSLPDGTVQDLYARLIKTAHEFQCRTFLDTSGEALRLGLGAKPWFVKPNREEVSKLLGMEVNSSSKGVAAVERLLELGAQSAALSLGSEGLLFCSGTGELVLHAAALPVAAHSTVGCGDSAVAGFAFGLASKLATEEALRLATACATANCLAEWPGAAKLEDIRNFERQVLVQKLATA